MRLLCPLLRLFALVLTRAVRLFVHRDAITLSILATSAAGQAYNQEPPSKDVEDPSRASIPAPGLRVRQVAPDVSFVKYRTKPYEEDDDRTSALDSLALLIQPGPDTDLMQSYVPRMRCHIALGPLTDPDFTLVSPGRYMQNDGLAIPIWSRDHFQADPNINEGLQCALLTTGMGCKSGALLSGVVVGAS